MGRAFGQGSRHPLDRGVGFLAKPLTEGNPIEFPPLSAGEGWGGGEASPGNSLKSILGVGIGMRIEVREDPCVLPTLDAFD